MSNERMVSAMQALQEITDQVAVPMKGGKRYVMVKDRIEIFRREFGDEYGVITNVDYSQGFDTGAAVVASAMITKDGETVASGWAVEYVGSTKLTDASPVEVAETSAIGRALACFGLAGGEYASVNEMEAHERKQDFRSETPGRREQQGNWKVQGTDIKEFRGNGGQVGNPELARQVERNRPMAGTPRYVPMDADAFWLQPDLECERIVNEIEGINTTADLGKYWSELKPTVDIMKRENMGLDLIAEIKAAFATRHNALGSQR